MANRNRAASKEAQMRRAIQTMRTLLALRRCVQLQCAPLEAAQMDLWLRLVGAGIVEMMRKLEAASGSAA